VVDEDTPGTPVRHELSSAANWFFTGHRNKLTLELSRLTLEDPVSRGKVWRIRFQWDVSI
jgi:phosphate-selective porin OprO and OprP